MSSYCFPSLFLFFIFQICFSKDGVQKNRFYSIKNFTRTKKAQNQPILTLRCFFIYRIGISEKIAVRNHMQKPHFAILVTQIIRFLCSNYIISTTIRQYSLDKFWEFVIFAKLHVTNTAQQTNQPQYKAFCRFIRLFSILT